MTTYDEASEQEVFQEILTRLRAQDERFEAFETELAALKEACAKCVQDRGKAKEEIVADCEGCKHPLTEVEIKEPVCRYCRNSSKFIPRSSES
jgi:hypothetical protein